MIQEANSSASGGQQAHTYDGGAFHPAFPSGRATGTLVVGSLAVHFTGKAGELELPLAGLDITLGGASDRIVFFKNPSQPETTVYTSDHEILKEGVFTERPELARQVAKVRGKKRSNSAILVVALAIMTALLVGIFAAVDPMVTIVADSIPPSAEITLGDSTFKAFTIKYTFVEEAELQASLKALTEPLVKGMKDAPYDFRFYIVKDETLNAFALPGGHIVIHSGLILGAGSPEELAGAIAHEMAHVKLRHSVKRWVKSMGTWLVFSMFLGDVQDRVGILTKNAQNMLNQHYTRDQEREADDIGWELMLATQRDPRGTISFFQKMLLLETAAGLKTNPYTDSHPSTGERIARLEEKAKTLPKDRKYQGFDLNFEEFQNSLRAKLKKEVVPEKPAVKSNSGTKK